MHTRTVRRLDEPDESELTVGGVPGVLWTPTFASPATPVPLILLGQPGGLGLERMRPRLAARARALSEQGFAALAIEPPGAGERAPMPEVDAARADLRRAIDAGEKPADEVVDRLILPLVDQAVPEWQNALDEMLLRPEFTGRVGFSGGVIAIGTRLAAIDPRIAAASLFSGSYVPRATRDEARQVTIPLHVLLQWDDEGNDRQAALDLFDAFGSAEKTLYASMGGHTGVPSSAGDDAVRFFVRHLGPSSA
ncbi:dienelactone hydrolase family protein [Microbacterium gorillae]|uniref:alpha/beta hydrolase n=1 Tax=Microbacterium gorillae TaxID=1231063 RepID=UPI00058D0665|nr:alpha/beta hydrolase [Microbacterium gorillae]